MLGLFSIIKVAFLVPVQEEAWPDVNLGTGFDAVDYWCRRVEMSRIIPEKVIVSVDVDSFTARMVRRCRPQIFAPEIVGGHAAVSAVGIGLGENEDIKLVYDILNLRGRETLSPRTMPVFAW